MQFSLSWLKKWVNLKASIDEISSLLFSLGLEVEEIVSKELTFSGVKIARVIAMRPHPNATRLKIASVIVEEGAAPIQVVCGAKNCREHLTVAYAPPGACLGEKIMETCHLRGEVSHGMLCAPWELGVDILTDGLWELPDDLPLGKDLRLFLPAGETILNVSITPNRGDCLCVKGIARELGAKLGIAINQNNAFGNGENGKSPSADYPIRVDDNAAVASYAAVSLRGLNLEKRVPLFIQEALCSAGLKPVHYVVDLLNYFMLDQGQPLHAFDADQISGPLSIRQAYPNEQCVLLNGTSLVFDKTLPVVIADDCGILCLAGILGCQRAKVSPTTKNILIESANFCPKLIAQTRQDYQIVTEASTRFERGIDPNATLPVLKEVTDYLWKECAEVGAQCSGIIEVKPFHSAASRELTLSQIEVQSLLGGRQWTSQETEHSLRAIGCDVQLRKQHSDHWIVIPPSWRGDLQCAEDLIEAIGRYIGYDAIAASFPQGELYRPEAPILREQRQTFEQKQTLNQELTQCGYFQVCSFAFTSPQLQTLFFNEVPAIAVPRPISAQLSELKHHLIPGLVEMAQFNLNRQQTDVRLFELAACFQSEEKEQGFPVRESLHLAMLLAHEKNEPLHWHTKTEAASFFELKGDCLFALKRWGMKESDIQILPDDQPIAPFLHPGQRACILYQEKVIGFMGQLSPKFTELFKLGQPCFVAEVELPIVETSPALTKFSSISRFPLTRRDLSFVVDVGLSAGDLLAFTQRELNALKTSLKLEAQVQLSDLYFSQPSESDPWKCVSLTFLIQSIEKNLTDSEIAFALEAITTKISNRFHAKLRHEVE